MRPNAMPPRAISGCAISRPPSVFAFETRFCFPLHRIVLTVSCASFSRSGSSTNILHTKLLPSADAARAAGKIEIEDDDAVSARAGATLERIFGWTPQNLFGAQPLAAPRFAAAEARFKMPAGRNQVATSLYAAYANFLAVVVLLVHRHK